MKCALCHDTCDGDHPGLDGALVEINPQTMRRATMHGWCLRTAIEDLSPEAKDRYIEHCQGN